MQTGSDEQRPVTIGLPPLDQPSHEESSREKTMTETTASVEFGNMVGNVMGNALHTVGIDTVVRELTISIPTYTARRLRRRGRITTVPAPAVTSARRWLDRGIWRTTLLNNLIVLAYHLGISPTHLAKWYKRARD